MARFFRSRIFAAVAFVVTAPATGCGGSSGTAPPGTGDPSDGGGPYVPAGDAGDGSIGANDGASTAMDSAAPPGDALADAGPAPDMGPGGDFRAYADAIAASLQSFYDDGTGLFPSTGWWNSANAITALADYSIATGSTSYVADFATTFAKNGSKNFLNDYYDDEGWWALAWIRVFDLTKDDRYLAMAKTIFADMTGGWDATCTGGIWWSKARTYKNAIANELFFQVAVRLHERSPNDGAGAGSFLDWAKREWAWFDASGMIGAGGLVSDGLDASCKNNGGATWSYNQGVIVGALVDLAAIDADATLLSRATAIANAAMTKLADARGVLGEPCGSACSGGDVPQFKGIFARHLAELQAVTKDPGARAFLATNADWIWNAARGPSDAVGLYWTGPFDSGDAARQGAALDAMNAAMPFAAPETNALLHKSATSNGECAADQGADKAVDGNLATKWCAGTSTGSYWIAVDLGVATPVSVGRVLLRHAGAGGEKQVWNTRDFTLETSMDGAAWTTVATVTGNTLPVTIHRFAPMTTRHVRVSITAPQTDSDTVAARLYEIEAYPR